MTAAGLIFSNIHDAAIPELTRIRTMASVPFGCRYRLIDFTLSNMVNSDINKIGVITHYNYQSLLDHIGTGKDWDLARRSGGIKILPPFITAYENSVSGKVYNTRIEALLGVMNFINRCTEDYFVLSDCDVVCNIDMAELLAEHEKSHADMTIVTHRLSHEDSGLSSHEEIIKTDVNGRIVDNVKYTPTEAASMDDVDISMNVMVMRRTYLQNILQDAMARGYTSFYRDIVAKHIKSDNYRVYRYDGYYALVSSLASYFDCSMQLLSPKVRTSLFGITNRPIYTKVRNSPPTKYAADAKVKNSLIADGCVIEGVVENSILFRGVKVGVGTVVKNSILMQDTFTGSNVNLNCVITDKNVVIKDGRILSGHNTQPFFIGKGVSV